MKMFSKQRGIFLLLPILIGICFSCSSITFFLFGLRYAFPNRIIAEVTSKGLYVLFLTTLFSLVLIVFGKFLMEIFPSIRITEQGVEVKKIFSILSIYWTEIERIEDLRILGTKLIVFTPKRNFVLKLILYYQYYLYGIITGTFKPVILLTLGLDNRDVLINEIEKNISDH